MGTLDIWWNDKVIVPCRGMRDPNDRKNHLIKMRQALMGSTTRDAIAAISQIDIFIQAEESILLRLAMMERANLSEPQPIKAIKSKKPKELKITEIINYDDKEKILDVFRSLIIPRSGKANGLLIKALEELKYINYTKTIRQADIYRAIREEFGDIGSDSGLNKYYKLETYYKAEYMAIKEAIALKL